MTKLSEEKKKQKFFKIYEQVYKNPAIISVDVAVETKISRNTVAKYLKIMHAESILVGPRLVLNPAPNYKEYVYLANSDNPYLVTDELKGDHHVVYVAVTSGNWNTMVITDNELDLSGLPGIQDVVTQSVKGFTRTPKVEYVTWDESFQRISEKMSQPVTEGSKRSNQAFPPLDWGGRQWELFCIFINPRKIITPNLRESGLRYETYAAWMKTLETHCTIDTRFYPEGYDAYLSYYFLVSSDYESTVEDVFSLLPTSPLITELEDQLLIHVALPGDTIKRLIQALYDMKEKKIVEDFTLAVVLSGHETDPHFRKFKEVYVRKFEFRG